MLSYNLFRIALVGVLALLLVRPAAAVVEQVPPETAYSAQVYRWISSGQAYSQSFEGHLQSCMLWAGVNKPLATYAVMTSGTTASGTCTLYNSGGGWVGSVGFARSSVCPTNYTWNGSQCVNPTSCPVAEPPYTYNPATLMCEREAVAPPCPASGTLHSDGFFNVGTIPTGSLLNTACISSCRVNLISGVVPAATQILDGVKYYFGQAKYEHTGASCTPDTSNFLSDFVGSLPSTSCGVGQQMITMSGVTKCFDSEGAEVNVNSASAVAAIVAQGDAAYAAMMADTAVRITAMGGTASDVVAAQTVAAGVFSAGGSSGDSSGGDEVMNAFCADNPTASICAEQNFGTVEDVSLTENTINVSITPVAVGGAGSCPAPSPLVLRGQTYYFVWDTYCQFASGIKPILLAFAWLAAGGILIGGFRA